MQIYYNVGVSISPSPVNKFVLHTIICITLEHFEFPGSILVECMYVG